MSRRVYHKNPKPSLHDVIKKKNNIRIINTHFCKVFYFFKSKKLYFAK